MSSDVTASGTGDAEVSASGGHEIRLHSFSGLFMEQTSVHGQFILLNGSLMVWVGTEPPVLDALMVSMQTGLDDEPASTSVLGKRDESDDNFTQQLAARIVKRTKQVVFLSYNLSVSADRYLEQFVQQLVFAELKKIGL